MFAIFKKELRSYFINAVGYVYVGVFLAAAAVLCGLTTLGQQSYSTSEYFTGLIFAFIVLIPLLTMKLFAEEKKLKTEQLLLTAPISIIGMVFGKFLAAYVMFAGCMVFNSLYFLILNYYAALKDLCERSAQEVDYLASIGAIPPLSSRKARDRGHER